MRALSFAYSLNIAAAAYNQSQYAVMVVRGWV